MTPRRWLVAWALAVVGATLVHDPAWLGVALALAVAGSGRGRGRLGWRAARAVWPVMAVISAGYTLMAWWTGADPWGFPLLVNVRVALLAYLTAWLARDLDLDRALTGHPGARRWLTVVRGQLIALGRFADERRAAVASRATARPTLRQRRRAAAALGLGALDKAVCDAEAVTQAMRSRGAFDD